MAYPACMTTSVPAERIERVSDHPANLRGDFVLYWMERSQRTGDNPSLVHAVHRAHELKLPLLVAAHVNPHEPRMNLRHLEYQLRGLRDVQASLTALGVRFVLSAGDPTVQLRPLMQAAAWVVVDRVYLRHQKSDQITVLQQAESACERIEGDVVVPTHHVTNKREYAARTLRPKIMREIDAFLDAADTPAYRGDWAEPPATFQEVPFETAYETLRAQTMDDGAWPLPDVPSGEHAASHGLDVFLADRFNTYDAHRNQPQTDDVSHLSKPLRYGHIAPTTVVRRARTANVNDASLTSFIEELVVRRELAINFVEFSPDDYDRYNTLPEWARKTLDEHRHDERTPRYDLNTLEAADTHDPYWNAAMDEMRHSGYMHNYMRMYWGKKILEWTSSPEEAFQAALVLNDRWFLDGRDPNSYTGVAWCFGLHDRAWTERAVFGKIRYMNAAGLKRKADPDAYVAKVERLKQQSRLPR